MILGPVRQQGVVQPPMTNAVNWNVGGGPGLSLTLVLDTVFVTLCLFMCLEVFLLFGYLVFMVIVFIVVACFIDLFAADAFFCLTKFSSGAFSGGCKCELTTRG